MVENESYFIKFIEDIKRKCSAEEVKGLIITTSSWREVFFYAKIAGKWIKSYDMAEYDLIESTQLETFEKLAADYVSRSENFREDMINVMEFGTEEAYKIYHTDPDTSTYSITKEWKIKNLQ